MQNEKNNDIIKDETMKNKRVFCFLISNPWFNTRDETYIAKFSESLEIEISNDSTVVHSVETSMTEDFMDCFIYLLECIEDRACKEDLIKIMDNM